jgi:hypothetical protein
MATEKQIQYAQNIRDEFEKRIRQFEPTDAGLAFIARLVVTPENAVAYIESQRTVRGLEFCSGLALDGEQDAVWANWATRPNLNKVTKLLV